jgi:hypothetical protein
MHLLLASHLSFFVAAFVSVAGDFAIVGFGKSLRVSAGWFAKHAISTSTEVHDFDISPAKQMMAPIV